MNARRILLLASINWLLWSVGTVSQAARTPAPSRASHFGPLFDTSHNCVACHNGLVASSGEDVSIGSSWRASMMANSSRDPYWQASVRREVIDHPLVKNEIEDECATCHMPMSRVLAKSAGRQGAIFAHLPSGRGGSDADRLATDGVSCTLCHQIQSEKLGTPESFTGGFVVGDPALAVPRPMFGPFETDAGRTTIMRSATGFIPAEAAHIRQSELCATCHTLYTQARGPRGEVIGRLPEQVPYLEWRQSAFRAERSCQSCHMPAVEEATPIASVLGEPRSGLARHGFQGGNAFMLRMLSRYRAELGVEALPHELDAVARATIQQLQTETATVSIERAEASAGRLAIEVAVRNLTGHKLPTGYPSRRVWLRLKAIDRAGRTVFESGGVEPNGSIKGNDADADAGRFEPHYEEIHRDDEVQVYESMMVDRGGAVTTGLLQGVRFVKDNRLLPRGFDKARAEPDTRVEGHAGQDADFAEGGDRIRYLFDTSTADGPFQIEVELLYQPISFRWADNLRRYDAPEPRRFVSFFDSMAPGSATVLARSTVVTK